MTSSCLLSVRSSRVGPRRGWLALLRCSLHCRCELCFRLRGRAVCKLFLPEFVVFVLLSLMVFLGAQVKLVEVFPAEVVVVDLELEVLQAWRLRTLGLRSSCCSSCRCSLSWLFCGGFDCCWSSSRSWRLAIELRVQLSHRVVRQSDGLDFADIEGLTAPICAQDSHLPGNGRSSIVQVDKVDALGTVAVHRWLLRLNRAAFRVNGRAQRGQPG